MRIVFSSMKAGEIPVFNVPQSGRFMAVQYNGRLKTVRPMHGRIMVPLLRDRAGLHALATASIRLAAAGALEMRVVHRREFGEIGILAKIHGGRR